jgi:8-oxo-dGTP diphosphatase
MSYEATAHEAQLAILRHLLFVPEASFSDVQRTTDMTSDHFNFHIKKLMQEGYVEKKATKYTLTPKGKEYANRLDTDENVVEKQPKVSVVVVLERRGDNDEREFLFQQRLKQPYYGFWGKLGGKMRWGESILEAANRELEEEAGLSAEFTYTTLYHKRDYDAQTKELLEDKLFLICYAVQYSGELIEDYEGGKNRWMTIEEFSKTSKHFSSIDDFIALIDQDAPMAEREFYYDKSEY